MPEFNESEMKDPALETGQDKKGSPAEKTARAPQNTQRRRNPISSRSGRKPVKTTPIGPCEIEHKEPINGPREKHSGEKYSTEVLEDPTADAQTSQLEVRKPADQGNRNYRRREQNNNRQQVDPGKKSCQCGGLLKKMVSMIWPFKKKKADQRRGQSGCEKESRGPNQRRHSNNRSPNRSRRRPPRQSRES